MIESVLVANRGEIARRIIRPATRLGIRAIAVYSEADADLPFVLEADEAVLIGIKPDELSTRTYPVAALRVLLSRNHLLLGQRFGLLADH